MHYKTCESNKIAIALSESEKVQVVQLLSQGKTNLSQGI